jgi:hypothetical protein
MLRAAALIAWAPPSLPRILTKVGLVEPLLAPLAIVERHGQQGRPIFSRRLDRLGAALVAEDLDKVGLVEPLLPPLPSSNVMASKAGPSSAAALIAWAPPSLPRILTKSALSSLLPPSNAMSRSACLWSTSAFKARVPPDRFPIFWHSSAFRPRPASITAAVCSPITSCLVRFGGGASARSPAGRFFEPPRRLAQIVAHRRAAVRLAASGLSAPAYMSREPGCWAPGQRYWNDQGWSGAWDLRATAHDELMVYRIMRIGGWR